MNKELTPAESRVAGAIMHGRSNAQIAAELGLSISTVKFHLRNIYRKTGAATDRELLAKALKESKNENLGDPA